MAGQEDQFGKPGWNGRNIVWAGVNLHERCRKRGHRQLLPSSIETTLGTSIVHHPTVGSPSPVQLVAHLVGAIDITYVRLGHEFIYLAVILDVFTRDIRG